MKAVIQRVKSAKVTVNNEIIGDYFQRIHDSFLCRKDDNPEDHKLCSQKLIHLRIFPNDDGNFTFQ